MNAIKKTALITLGAGTYWTKIFSDARRPRIVMALLVRNEEDIIEMNIRFHANKGVDAFIVMDNGSEDRTCEIIQELANEYELMILKHNDDMARISIRDSGCGMTAEFIRTRLFRPFDTTKGSQGMGIGVYQAAGAGRR